MILNYDRVIFTLPQALIKIDLNHSNSKTNETQENIEEKVNVHITNNPIPLNTKRNWMLRLVGGSKKKKQINFQKQAEILINQVKNLTNQILKKSVDDKHDRP